MRALVVIIVVGAAAGILAQPAPRTVIARRVATPDVSVRRTLLLALGDYEPGAFEPGERIPLMSRLRAWRTSDPDPGVHSAVDWLMWRLASVTPWRLPATPLAPDRGWYVTAEGQTMAVVRGPSRVEMGSPSDEPGRVPASDSPDEPRHAVEIPRSFAIATTETTVAEFRRFLTANPDVARSHAYDGAPQKMAEVHARFSPDDDGPAIAVTWYEAAMYCNWLSERDGLPRSEWVYPVGPLADGARLPADYLHRGGYRLPTEAEWELAARAGTRTARFFGTSPQRLGEYAWFSRNPPKAKSDPVDPKDPQRTSPVARLKPNDLGLFDVYGNVWEWTQDRVDRHQRGAVAVDGEDQRLDVRDADARTRRGGAFPYGAEMARSAARGTINSLPTNRRDNVGFRVARTVR
jgi:formylglycine-generating enzyme required for sulfatase activity